MLHETLFRFISASSSGFVEKTDEGWYGAGIYFSEYPSYFMDYVQGADRLLLCQVLPGKVGFCQGCKNSLFLVGFRNI
jgi:aprataxin and PNK-like factor